MPASHTARSIQVAARVNRFSYAIRNIVNEAKAVEARGMRVRYLNIGDPVAFGFKTPPHLVAAAERAMHDGHNGYLPSQGILEAREAVAADYRARGVPVTADRVLITTGTSEGIDLALNALVDEGDDKPRDGEGDRNRRRQKNAGEEIGAQPREEPHVKADGLRARLRLGHLLTHRKLSRAANVSAGASSGRK